MSITAAKLMVIIGGDASGAQKALGETTSQMDGFARNAQKVGNQLSTWVTLPLLGVGVAATKLAADFDRNMNVLQETSDATAEDVASLRKEAEALGADLTLPGTSAADAAEAMLELSKAGMKVNDVMAASRGVLQMAAAGQVSNAEAATIAANAMNAFNLEGEEATRIADLLAAAANASSAEITDVADAMKMASAVFASAGMPIEDLTTAISEMANKGIMGSDAGTSLKQMILSLQGPTDKSAKLMQELGISVYDAQGNMLPMEGIIGQFSNALGGLTQQQRNAALATIFGSDAVRAANVVLMGGVDAFQEMKTAVTEQGAAAGLAEAQTKGLGGMIDKVRSAAETAMLAGIEPLTDDIIAVADAVAQAMVNFSELDEGTRRTAVVLLGLAAGAGPAIKVLGVMSGAASALMGGFAGLASGALAAWKAWQAGLTLTTAMEVGFGAVAVTVASVTAAITAAIAVWAAWEKYIVQTNEAGQQMVENTWTKFFDDQVKSGKGAYQVLGEYNAAQGRVIAEMQGVAPIFREFIFNEEELLGSQEQLNQALAASATSYTEYQGAAEMAGIQTGILTEYQFDFLKNSDQMVQASKNQATAILEASGSYEEYAQKMQAAGLLLMVVPQAEYEMAKAATAATAAQAALNAELVSSSFISQSMSSALQAVGWSSSVMAQAERDLALALGEVSAQEYQAQADVDLLSQAYANGVISASQYADYMRQAKDGTLQLSQAQRESIGASTQQAQALRTAAQAAQEMAIKQMDLAQSLKDATDAQIAQAAISELGSAYQAGTLGFDDYVTAVGQVQETFGLADAKSRALAAGLMEITRALEAGQLPATMYDDALKAVIVDAGDGTLDVQALSDAFYVQTDATTEVQAGMTEAAAAMVDTADTAVTAAEQINKAFTEVDWVDVGHQIGAGITQGLNESADEIAAAAANAATTATDAANDAAQTHSPSRVSYETGRMIGAGLALGMSDSTEAIQSAAWTMANAALANLASGMTGGSGGEATRPGGAIAGLAAGSDEGMLKAPWSWHANNSQPDWRAEKPINLVVRVDGNDVKDVMVKRLGDELV